MKKNILFVFCLFSLVNLFAQSKDVPDWENPEVFDINKEKTRATSIPYPNATLASSDVYSSSPYYQTLNGIWNFKWFPRVGDIPTGFHVENYDDSKWDKMPVPGNWEFNGFGIPMYINMNFGIVPKNPPYINREDSPTGLYRHSFDIPTSWDGRRVFIHFEAGTNSMYVWVNGQKVGYTQNAKSPAEFDITPYVRLGKNSIACEVHKFSDGTYLEDQDKWRIEGFNRDVFLYSTDQTRILDYFVHPDLDSNYKNGVFSVDVKLKNYEAKSQNQQVTVSILDNNGKSVLQKSIKTDVSGKGEVDVVLDGIVSNVKKWTAETPNLYTMLLELKDAQGKTVEVTSSKIGFRKIEITDGQFFINGKKVMFKGVNLHEFNTNDGNVVDRDIMMRNIRLMKELNINAIRTAHYPQPTLFYKLCDEYGFYVVDEANLESHGLGFGPTNVSNSPEWHAQHMDRIYRLIERDKNHVSVVTWSLGNEASNGAVYYDMYDWAKQRDKSRPTQYEQARKEERNTDIICPMYPSWETMKRDAARDIGRPYVLCEYAHAMGNSMGNFQEYWDLMRTSKNMQGGFIWEWYNHGYPAKDEQGRFYWAYGGDLKGYNKMNHGNFCMDGIISPDQKYLPHTYIVKKVHQDILFKAKDLEKGIVTITNDFRFTDLTDKNYTYKWLILKNGEAFAEDNFTVNLIEADKSKDIKLNLPQLNYEPATEYHLHLYAYLKEATPVLEAGFEVAKEEFAMPRNNYFVAKDRKGTLGISKNDTTTIVTSGSLRYEFSLQNGETLIAMTDDDQKVFRNLPRLNFWRAPTDNDFGSNDQNNLRLWDAASNNIIWKYIDSKEQNGAVAFNYEGKLRGLDAKVFVSYTINGNGSMTVDANYKALSDEMPEMMRFGMLMMFNNKDLTDFTWYGRGPNESYVDRKHDSFMGVWNGLVSEQAFEYYRPQETGNKTDVRWLTLKDKKGNGVLVEGAQPLSVSALNNLPEDFDAGNSKKQQHWSDVLPLEYTVLSVDLFQRGVAGLDSWKSRPFDEYRFQEKEYSYSYTISIIK